MMYDFFLSPLGRIIISTDGASITSFLFEEQKYFTPISPDWICKPDHPLLQESKKQLNEYFNGTRMSFNLPLSPIGTKFQQEVWSALEQIPCGRVTTYREIAHTIGRPKAVRAVGTAIGRNPLCIVVPCHRVIGVDGKLTGYSGGLKRKQWLLRHEQKNH